MWPIDCTKDTIKNRGSTVNIWRIKLSISSIFRSVKTSCLCKIPSAKKNIFLLQKFSVFSFSSYIFFFSEYFPPFPSPIFLLRSSSRYQNVKMSKFQCPHSISRTCLAQEFGLFVMISLAPSIIHDLGENIIILSSFVTNIRKWEFGFATTQEQMTTRIKSEIILLRS